MSTIPRPGARKSLHCLLQASHLLQCADKRIDCEKMKYNSMALADAQRDIHDAEDYLLTVLTMYEQQHT